MISTTFLPLVLSPPWVLCVVYISPHDTFLRQWDEVKLAAVNVIVD
jgi:hypothetical protein